MTYFAVIYNPHRVNNAGLEIETSWKPFGKKAMDPANRAKLVFGVGVKGSPVLLPTASHVKRAKARLDAHAPRLL